MAHYEARLQADESVIRERVETLSHHVQKALADSLHSLLSGNRELAFATILADARINEGMREVDGLCHRFIARHLPSAGHLRFTSAVMRSALQMERIGDYAVTIAREGVQLSGPPDGSLARELEMTADHSQRMLRLSLDAFNERNADKARGAMELGESMESTLDGIYEHLGATSEASRVKDLLALFVVFNMVKRVSDQAKDICEEAIFAPTGEVKAGRVHDVLFVDEDDSCLGPMAVAIAKRGFPDAARFASAGRNPAAEVDQGIVEFMEGHGYDLGDSTPSPLDSTPHALSRYFVVVSLEGPVGHYVPSIPFHTSLLTWDLGARPGPGESDAQRLEELYRQISSHVRDLVETLTGREGA